ncbi:MAG: glycoside hydrolase family 97 protein [Paludibacter sp.]|nr:glycoside hydrolase family 97 protein [Paludibacter sp.]
MKQLFLLSFILGFFFTTSAKEYTLQSPDNQLTLSISVEKDIRYSVSSANQQTLIAPSTIGMQLSDGTNWGTNTKVKRSNLITRNEVISTPVHFASEVKNHYRELTLEFRGDWGLRFRAYNDGVAYRFFYTGKKPVQVKGEELAMRFPGDYYTFTPYVANRSDGKKESFEQQFHNSFENTYVHTRLSDLNPDKLIFLPILIDAGNGTKICFTEADLESYPGLYLNKSNEPATLQGVLPAYPATTQDGGHNNLQTRVTQRENYIARVGGAREFPWRTAIITTADKDLAVNDMTLRLASPNRVGDISWIKPGKVAWDWWNDWNLYGVDFQAGINNASYKYYIDFASKKGIEYVILDEGWAVNLQADLLQVVPEIDIRELVDYARERNVDIILWAGYRAFDRDMENVCRHYAAMGVKGFKIDFMDRDDQAMVDFIYRAAETTARYKMLADFHGMYKPTGIQLTYPNVINFEGVFGLEQMKWSPESVDMVGYDVTVPFIRMVAGPMDYTQGAMKNAARGMFRPIHSDPMSQGTRCRQLALYVIYNSPLNMLCDSPSEYLSEPASTDFIANIPVVWDESKAINGAVGEFVTLARRNGKQWYLGGITNWNQRQAEVKLDFLSPGREYTMTLYKDGVNAAKKGTDHVIEQRIVNSTTLLQVPMAPGGGFAASFE